MTLSEKTGGAPRLRVSYEGENQRGQQTVPFLLTQVVGWKEKGLHATAEDAKKTKS